MIFSLWALPGKANGITTVETLRISVKIPGGKTRNIWLCPSSLRTPLLAVFWFFTEKGGRRSRWIWPFRCCTARTGRTEQCRGFLRWRIFRWWDAIPSPRLFVWIRTGHIFLPMRREFPSRNPFPLAARTGRRAMGEIAAKLRCPIFVKPLRAGSSFGITKISSMEELENALDPGLRQ